MIFKVWGIPFVLVGVYIVAGRFFVDAWARAGTYYAVTNERIIITSGRRTRQTKSVMLRTMAELSIKERSDGTGTIVFGPQIPAAGRLPQGWPGSSQNAAPSLDMIERVKEVYKIIQRARREAR